MAVGVGPLSSSLRGCPVAEHPISKAQIVEGLDGLARELGGPFETANGLASVVSGHRQPAEIEPGVGVGGILRDGLAPVALGLLELAQALTDDPEKFLERGVVVAYEGVLEMAPRGLVAPDRHQVERQMSIEEGARDGNRIELGVELEHALGGGGGLLEMLALMKGVREQGLACDLRAWDLDEPLGDRDDLTGLGQSQPDGGEAFESEDVVGRGVDQLGVKLGGLEWPIEQDKPQGAVVLIGRAQGFRAGEMALGLRVPTQADEAAGRHEIRRGIGGPTGQEGECVAEGRPRAAACEGGRRPAIEIEAIRRPSPRPDER